MAFLVFLTLLIPGVTHSGQKKNVWFNFNLLVLCDSAQISILDKALWHVLEKNVCFPDSWWNVLDCIIVHILWVWYWVTDLEVLSPVEITSLNFFLLNFSFRFISVYFTHWILWCWVHTELCLPIELTHLILSLLLVKGFTLQSALSGVSVAILTVFGYRWHEISV